MKMDGDDVAADEATEETDELEDDAPVIPDEEEDAM